MYKISNKTKEKAKGWYIYTPYSKIIGANPDFEVEYIREVEPELDLVRFKQGLRVDFLYEGDDPKIEGIHMIWPEFLDKQGNVILDKRVESPDVGNAVMWILSNESRQTIHKQRIKVGTQGYWMAGSKKLARVTVTKILGLYTN